MLKAIIAALTLVAVAAQPVVASWIPCCCTKPEQRATPELREQLPELREQPKTPERSCCQTAEHVAKSPATTGPTAAACCAQNQTPADIVVGSGCCCVKAPPAVPSSPDQPKQIIEQPSIEPSCSSVDCLVPAPAIRRFEQLPGVHTLTGPPLLALYCIWLK
jgi:hypothetical protein